MSRRSSSTQGRRYGRFAALALALTLGPVTTALVLGRGPARNTDVPANRAASRLTPTGTARSASAFFAPPSSPAARAVAGVRGAPIATTSRGDVIADELIVRPGRDAMATAQAIAAAGGRVVWSAPRTGLLLVRFASAADARVARGQLASDGRIAGLFENRIMEGASVPANATEARAAQWHLAALKVPATRSAAGVTVAVLDSGVAYETYSDASGSYAQAPDLAATPFAPGWDFIHDDAHPNDDHGHGTHVTALIAGNEPVPGVAPGATILPVKVLDAANLGTELGLAEGLRYAVDHGADVVNLSLSFGSGFFPSRFLQDAVDHASAHGVVLVAAAGNQGGTAVAYPAAFREAIAVGASRIWDQYRSPASTPWQSVEQYLRRAEYSNRGFRLDVVAPGGGLDGDANQDGAVDTVVAQTIVPGQPAQHQYRLWAGTSQAAAQVSGVVALMLASDPSLTAAKIRAILGETAAPEAGGAVLSSLVGRGFLRVDAALAAVAAGAAERPRFAAAVRVALVDSGGARRGRATVEILDSAGQPVPNAQVYGTFTGGAFAVQHGVTGADGTVTFLSPDLGTAPVVAFQVDAVSDRASGPTQVFDRPSGAIKIDSCSLQLLSEYASQLGATDGGASLAAGTAITTSPDQEAARGSGITTSPSPDPGGAATAPDPDDAITTSPLAGAGITTSPDEGDLTGGSVQALSLAIHLPAQADEIDAVVFTNLSWTGSTLPMAVVAEAGWLEQTAPSTHVARSYGQGVTTSPLQFRADSFDLAVPAPGTACSDLVLRTFAPAHVAAGLAPVDVRGCADGAACAETASDVWTWASGQAITTSPRRAAPAWSGSTGMTEPAYQQLVLAVGTWASLGPASTASPVADYDSLLVAAGLDVLANTSGESSDALSCGPDTGGAALSPALVIDPAQLGAVCTATY
jgi:hypothetical protein